MLYCIITHVTTVMNDSNKGQKHGNFLLKVGCHILWDNQHDKDYVMFFPIPCQINKEENPYVF